MSTPTTDSFLCGIHYADDHGAATCPFKHLDRDVVEREHLDMQIEIVIDEAIRDAPWHGGGRRVLTELRRAGYEITRAKR